MSNVKSSIDNNSTNKVQDTLDTMYVDEKHIKVSVVHNYSTFRKVNQAAYASYGPKAEVIGSSIKSCQVLSSNTGELEKYFPSIIGVNPTNPEFMSRVKAYLSNIQIKVSDNITFNASFIYEHKSDYLAIKSKEEEIEEEFEKADRNNIIVLKKAVAKYVDAINDIESTKWRYGKPENIKEYLMWRHLLLYKDVAKDAALINSDPSIRFFIINEAKEENRKKQLTIDRKKAMQNYLEISATPSLKSAVYIMICVYRNEALSVALNKQETERDSILMDFVNNYPAKFNKFVADKNIVTKAFIEKLVMQGELIRSDFNQNLTTREGTFIGANLDDAVSYFNNPNNAEARQLLEKKLKVF